MEAYESEIKFHLAKMSGGLVKDDRYRAVIDTDRGESVDAVKEICAGSQIDEAELRYVVGLTFERMIKGVLADGQTRRFENLFEIYPAVQGGFTRIDEQFDSSRHKLVAKFFPLVQFKGFVRKTPLVNVRSRPRGRIDYVTSPGGEKGEVVFGKDIVIYGHDLTLSYLDTVDLRLPDGTTFGWAFNFDENGNPKRWLSGKEIKNEGFVEWDDNHIRIKWFPAIKKEDAVGKKVTVRFRPWTRDEKHYDQLKDVDHMGSATKVVVLAP